VHGKFNKKWEVQTRGARYHRRDLRGFGREGKNRCEESGFRKYKKVWGGNKEKRRIKKGEAKGKTKRR